MTTVRLKTRKAKRKQCFLQQTLVNGPKFGSLIEGIHEIQGHGTSLCTLL